MYLIVAGRVATHREQMSKELAAIAKHGMAQEADHALVVPDVGHLGRVTSSVLR